MVASCAALLLKHQIPALPHEEPGTRPHPRHRQPGFPLRHGSHSHPVTACKFLSPPPPILRSANCCSSSPLLSKQIGDLDGALWGGTLRGVCSICGAPLQKGKDSRKSLFCALEKKKRERTKTPKHSAGDGGRRKLSKEKKTKKKNKPASQGRTTCKWGKVFYEVQLSFLQVQQETDCTWT